MSIQARFTLDHGEFRLDVDLALPLSGVSVLFGASGSGKTTILRCLAGLEPKARGRLQVGEQVWQDDAQGLCLPPHQRELGMVFQEASLFPHLSVRRNLEYGLRRTPPAARRVSWQQALVLLGIEHLLDRSPAKLSGGERQRVAIARALLTSPRLLLLDEPLSALDFRRKQDILPYLERLQAELDLPIVYVSHAIEEVIRLADHLVLIDQGRVVAAGSPTDTLSRLDLPAQFSDEASVVLDTHVDAVDPHYSLAQLGFAGGTLWLPASGLQAGQASRVRIHARDVSLALTEHADSSILNRLPAVVSTFAPATQPGHMLIRCELAGGHIVARITRRSFDALALRPGLQVWLQIKAMSLIH
ncbi:molybdenum ABC transporter ATP-binding protein [Chitinivorax sp. PXF-14]|uniref:molybdenum ABC transporter ATP-binding protein n=1 Tax=Chitinivorax sp. PXF-14 TaxID=3230488 RepID=UPI003466500C